MRYATWTYDSVGRATSSEHATPGGGIDKVSINYDYFNDLNDARVSITNELGKTKTYHYESVLGVRKVTHVEGDYHENASDSSVSCAAANQYTSYDANGYKDIVTDWKGNVVNYDFDANGLETQRIEGLRWAGDIVGSSLVDTLAKRDITTLWHPDFRLPTRITEPDQVVDMTYDCDNGRMENRTVHPNPAPVYTAPSCP